MASEELLAPLAEATLAARAADWALALRHALAAWLVAPRAALAAAIERLGPRAARSIPPLDGEAWSERNKRWFSAARRRDPIELHDVLVTLTDVRGDAELVARMEKLARIADPRIATRLREVAGEPVRRHWYQSQRYIRDRLAALAHPEPTDDDPAVATALAALAASLDTAASDADDAAREAELLAEIYAAPDDDGPRLVYADWLQARREPRGEFIALQIVDRMQGLTRAQALSAVHGAAWLGSLAPHVEPRGYGFARGFLAFCQVAGTERPPEDPAWATVAQTNGRLPPLASARALRHACVLDAHELAYLTSFPDPPPIEHLALAEWPGDFDPRTGTWDATSRAESAALSRARERFPHLRRFVLTGTETWVAGDGMTPAQLIWPWRELGIAELEIPTALVQLAAWLAAFDDAPALERVRLATRGGQWVWGGAVATITRERTGARSLSLMCGTANDPASARAETAAFATALAMLPPDALASIFVDLPKRALVDGSPELASCLAAIDGQRLATRTIRFRGKVPEEARE